MSKEAKAVVDAKIYADVKGGMTKTAAAKKYGTSARSVGRAIERHLASGATAKVATPKKVKTATPKKAKAVTETQVQYYEMREGEPVAVTPVVDLEIGDTVVLSRKSSYRETHLNPLGVLGIVKGVDDWVGVDWSNGHHNAYPSFGRNDLLLVAKSPDAKAETQFEYLTTDGETILVQTSDGAIPQGALVVLNSDSEYADGPQTLNPVGVVGTIEYIRESDGWARVQWPNDRTNVYPQGGAKDLLILVPEEDAEQVSEEPNYLMFNGNTIVVKAPTGAIPTGTRVVLSRESCYAGEPKSRNPVGIFGTLQQIRTDGWSEVTWSNGKGNCYPDGGVKDLLLFVSEEVKEDDSADWECDEDCTTLVTEDSTVLEALKGGMAVEYINTSSSVVLTLNNETEIVEETHPNFKEIQIAIVSGEFAKAFELMNIRKSIESFTRGAVSIKGDKLFYGNVEIKSSIVERILDLMRAGDEGFKTLVAFFEKLMENPSRDSVEQLWGFISHNDIEIDSEGYIIGWKKVRELEDGSLVDSRTKKVPNDIGNRVSMPRWMVDADKYVTCSQGLHVGAIGYVRQFSGDTIIKVRVHPRDVVSVPVDYHDQKMRVSAYGVLCKADSDCKEIPIEDFGRIKEDVVVGAAGELISRNPL